MDIFRPDNTEGYTKEQLEKFNTEWELYAKTYHLEEHTEKYNQEAGWFCDEVAKR